MNALKIFRAGWRQRFPRDRRMFRPVNVVKRGRHKARMVIRSARCTVAQAGGDGGGLIEEAAAAGPRIDRLCFSRNAGTAALCSCGSCPVKREWECPSAVLSCPDISGHDVPEPGTVYRPGQLDPGRRPGDHRSRYWLHVQIFRDLPKRLVQRRVSAFDDRTEKRFRWSAGIGVRTEAVP